MLLCSRRTRRRAAAAAEAALVYPILFLMIICTVVIGVAVFRYQQVAWLARAGARYASLHGPQYAADTGSSAATDMTNYVTSAASGMDTTKITVTTTWNGSGMPPTTTNQTEAEVTVSYAWTPEAFGNLLPTMNLSSTANMAMSY